MMEAIITDSLVQPSLGIYMSAYEEDTARAVGALNVCWPEKTVPQSRAQDSGTIQDWGTAL